MDATEELARWLHEAWLASPPGVKRSGEFPWDELPENARQEYRDVAAKLLADPPACLLDAFVRKALGGE